MPQVFITGATGWVGSVTVTEFLKHGYDVLALARSDKSAASLQAQGAKILRGTQEDLEILKQGAASSDASIHMAFPLQFDDFVKTCADERAALQAMASAIVGTDKVLIMTTGTGAMGTKHGLLDSPAKEHDVPVLKDVFPVSERVKTEEVMLDIAKTDGIRAMIVRLAPTVHGKGDFRFITEIGLKAKDHGKAIYPLEGHNRWPALYRNDAASLYRLAVEKGKGGAIFHAVAETGVPMKDIVTAIGNKIGIPISSASKEECQELYGGFLGMIVAVDGPVSNDQTRQKLGWNPSGLSLVEDIKQNYF